MKTRILLLLIIIFTGYRSYCQIGQQRGLYVDDFVLLDGAGTITPGSILGNIPKENELLTYCMQNHITYIALYNLKNVYTDGANAAAYTTLLCNFICKAKNDYCIKSIGGVVAGFETEKTILNWNRQSPPFIFDTIWHNTDLYTQLRFVEDTIPDDDERFRNAEDLKLTLRLMGGFGLGESSVPSCCHIDVLSLEYEFWNQEYYERMGPDNDFKELLLKVDEARENRNTLTPTTPTYVEVYLHELFDNHGSATACEIAHYIDNQYTNSTLSQNFDKVDRVLGTAYHDYGDNLYNPDIVNHTNAHNVDYRNKFLLFCETGEADATPFPSLTYSDLTNTFCSATVPIYTTIENTNYEPIFHAGSILQGSASDYLGTFLPAANNRNIFTVERKYFDDFKADANPIANVHTSPEANDVAPAATMWYTQGFMTNDLKDPITFLAYTTDCPGGGAQDISLVYQGPIEAGIDYAYTVTECSTSTPQSPSAGYSATGTTPVYTGDYTSGTPGVDPVLYSLYPGSYCISLYLDYGSGCGYTYNQKIIVSSDFRIQALKNPGNPTGPINFCEGEHVLLQANINMTSGATYQWFLDGHPILGANEYQYSATVGGYYSCVISGSCNGTSNTIEVYVNPNPVRTILASCPSSSGSVILTVFPNSIAGDSYTWSTAATTNSISVSVDDLYSISVSNNGCIRTASQEVTAAMLAGISALSSPSLQITLPTVNSTNNGPFCPGTEIRIRLNGGTTPAGLIPQVWNTGEITPRIFVTNPGNYFLILSDANGTGCEVQSSIATPIYSSPTVIINNNTLPTVCNGYKIDLTAVASGASTYTYSWSPSGICSPCNTNVAAPPIPLTQTTIASVLVTDNNSCHTLASTTYTVLPTCEELTKTVFPEKQYATLPVTYTITACNTDFANPSTTVQYTITDDPTATANINTIWQNPFSSVLWPLNNSTPVTTIGLLPGQCESKKLICSYNDIGERCNIAFITHKNGVQVGSTISSDACVEVLMNCPMSVGCKAAACSTASHVSVQLRNHKDILPSLKYFKARLVYPNFMTPSFLGNYNADPASNPLALSNPIVPGSTSTVSNLDVIHSTMSQPLAHSGSPGGYFISYNYVDVEIQYITPMVSPSVLADFDFTFNASPPFGINSFHIFVVDPVSGQDNHTFLGLSGTAGSLSYWTQAVGAVIPGCGVTGPIAEFDVNYIGCGGEVNVTSHYTGNYASKWEFGDNRSTPIFGAKDWTYDYFEPITQGQNGPINPIVPAALPGTYTITHTVYNGNNVASVATKVVIISESCCTADPGVDVPDESVSSTYGNDFSNKLVHIQGDFVIDADFTFEHSTVILENGASIFVENGKTLTSNNSYFYTCSGMWQGISLDATAHFISNESMIENATTAIACNETSEISIISSVFNKNTKGISITGTGNNTAAPFNGYIRGSVFTSRELEHAGISTLAANLRSEDETININSYEKAGARGQTAIYVFNYGASSSTPTYDVIIGDKDFSYLEGGNLFDNQDWGIRAIKSNVKIINNSFQEMSGTDKAGYSTGIGVWASSKANSTDKFSLKIGGTNSNENNKFQNCGIGVLASDYTHVSVLYNSISKTAGLASGPSQNYYGRFGVKLTNHTESKYDCNNNTISNMYYGIEWSQSTSKLAVCNFKFNNISTSVSSENCFAALYLHGPTVYDNPNSTVFIERNTITNTWNGVLVYNFLVTGLITISQNDDILIRNSDFPQYGVKVLNTRNVEITDNLKIRSYGKNNLNVTGVYLINAERAKINCNSIYDLGTGVGFSHSCISYSGEGVLHRNLFSEYAKAVNIEAISTIDDQGSLAHAADNEWDNPAGAAIDILNNNSAFYPHFFVRSHSLPFQPTPITISPFGSVSFTLAGTTNTTCSTSNTSSYFSYILTADERAAIEKQKREGVNFPVLEAQTKWMYAENSLQKLMSDSTISPSDSVLYNYRDSIHNTNIGMFYDINVSIHTEDWTQADTDNSSISFQNHIEENLKIFNSYFIEYRSDSTLGEDSVWLAVMITNISPIAAECYSTGGPAVYSSRTLLSYFTNSIYDDNTDCYRTPPDSIIASASNSACDLIKNYSAPLLTNATYLWTVPAGTSYIQSGNSISLNWGSLILSGGTITCTIMDSLGNTSIGSFIEDTLITSPTCVAVTANNTSCVSATSLSWNSPDGCAAGYYIWLGTNGGGTTTPDNVIDSLDIGNDTIYMLPFLQPGITYYYKIVPYNNSHTSVSGCTIGSFTSGSSVAFTPAIGNPYQEKFDGVTAPALPCGITVSDENFPKDGIVWETSSSASCSGSNSLAIGKNTNSTITKNDWFFSHPLNLSAGELYRISYKSKAETGFTESLETYVSQSADAATMLSTSPIINSNITSTSCISDSGEFIAPTSNVYFVGGHANSMANQGTLYLDDLKVNLIKTTRLTTASCGDSLYTCDTLHCIAYTGATSYKFRFENLTISFSQDYTVTTANPKVYQFLGTNPLVLGQNYSVTVAAYVNGVWTPFGSACEVYLRPVPIRGLTGASCGGTLTDLSQLIYTNTSGICLINDYKYEFTDQSNSTVIETQRNSATTSFLMTYITSPYVKYSTTYSVRVKLKIGNTWGEYGSACNVTTPASPLTKLSSTYCNYTLPTFATPVTCISVLGAQDYRYKITGPNNYDRTFTRNSSLNNWYFTWTNSSPYMQASTTYDVKVASSAGGVWSDYGDVCTITTPASLSRLADTTFLQQALQPIFDQLENSGNTLSLSVFPNPNNNDEKFSIELMGITESNQKIKLSIFNMVGASVFRSDINTKEETQILIQPEVKLASGIYIVEAELNGNKLRKKFVVQ